MALTREAVSLGLSARRAENIKVRQPLGVCTLVLSSEAQQQLLAKHVELIKDELNVKEVAFTATPEEYVSYTVKPNFKTLGPKFGKQVKTIGKVLEEGDGAAWFRQLQSGAIRLELEGMAFELSGDDLEVRLTPRDGFAAAQGKEMVVVLSTEITLQLKQEGLVRELVHAIQNIRKERNLAYDARIDVAVWTEDTELLEVIKSYNDAISAEVLAKSLELTENPDDAAEHTIDGKTLKLLVK
jgi:isoleucyl-tRNA synthetase